MPPCLASCLSAALRPTWSWSSLRHPHRELFDHFYQGERCVELCLCATVAEAKAAILQQCAPRGSQPGGQPCPASAVWVKFDGRALPDDETLESAGVRAGACLSLHVRARGGGCYIGKQTHVVAPSSPSLREPPAPATAPSSVEPAALEQPAEEAPRTHTAPSSVEPAALEQSAEQEPRASTASAVSTAIEHTAAGEIQHDTSRGATSANGRDAAGE